MIMNYHGKAVPKFFILFVSKKIAVILRVDVIENIEIYMYLVQFLNIFLVKAVPDLKA